MKKQISLLLFILVIITSLSAEETVLRPVLDIRLHPFHVATQDSCELIFWNRVNSGYNNVFCQKINALGELMWDQATMPISQSADLRLAAVVPASDGNFFMLVKVYEQDTAKTLRLQKVSPDGLALWQDSGVQVIQVPGSFKEVSLVPDTAGGAYVLYQLTTSTPFYGQSYNHLGAPLWPAEHIIDQQDSPNYRTLWDAYADGEGGVMLRFYNSFPRGYNYLRISASGSIMGTNPLLPPHAQHSGYSSWLPATGGLYLITVINLSQTSDYPSVLRLQLMDNQGNLSGSYLTILPPNLEASDSILTSINPSGDVYLAWAEFISYQKQFVVTKLDPNFDTLWRRNITQSNQPFNWTTRFSLSTHTNGTVWLSWNLNIVSQKNQNGLQIKTQALDSDGEMLFADGGVVLASRDTNYDPPMIFPYSDGALFLWQNLDFPNTAQIYRQVVSVSGNVQYSDSDIALIQGIPSWAILTHSIPLEDSYFTTWFDFRGTNFKVYYQIVTQNMTTLLEDYGRALNPDETDQEGLISAKKTANGSVYLLYCASSPQGPDFRTKVYLQKVDAFGDPEFPGRGIEIMISDFDEIWEQVHLGIVDEDAYLGWQEGSNYYQIMGQRIVNGEKVWGESGRLIVAAPADSRIKIDDLHGSYYQWKHVQIGTPGSYHKVLRVDANGDGAAGWDPYGMRVIVDEGYPHESDLVSGLEGENLVSIIFADAAGTLPACYRIQKINPAGQRLWTDQGVKLPSVSSSEEIMDVDFSPNLGILTLGRVDSYSQDMKIHFYKLSSSGELLTSPDDNPIVISTDPDLWGTLGKYADDSYICVIQQHSDLYYRMISPEGELTGSLPQLLCGAPRHQANVVIATIGNQGFVGWNDNRNGMSDYDEDFEIRATSDNRNSMSDYNFDFDIRATFVNSAFTNIDEPVPGPVARPRLEPNYPNPFNPSTTIAFSLPEAGVPVIKIYNLKGQAVKTLLADESYPPGRHGVIWNGTDDKNRPMSSGIYFSRLIFEGKSTARKMVLTK